MDMERNPPTRPKAYPAQISALVPAETKAAIDAAVGSEGFTSQGDVIRAWLAAGAKVYALRAERLAAQSGEQEQTS